MPGRGAVEFELSSHIEVIERLIRKAVTWTPSREAHVAGLEPGEPRTAHICSSAYVTPCPSSQSQENTQAGPAGPRSVVAHAMRRTARASWPGLWTVRKSSALCRLWQPLPMALGTGSESWRQAARLSVGLAVALLESELSGSSQRQLWGRGLSVPCGRKVLGPRGGLGLALDPGRHSAPVGPMLIEFNIPVDLELLAKQNPEVKVGGRYTPKDCISPHKVAIIIPFRNRQEHLKYWLYYLHPILQRQQLDYGIYVINQAGDSMFNRAKLLNIGFQEALKDYDYNCFVFSDVDLIPMDDHNAYRCFSQPRHISVAMDKFGFSLPYVQYFGGVSALSKDQFLAINGFPNNYWGWGGEDDDIFNRLVFRGMSISRPNAVVGRCRMIRHSRDKKNEPNPQRFDRIAHTKETMRSDGLNSLTYQVLDIQRNPLYTKITVDIGTPS